MGKLLYPKRIADVEKKIKKDVERWNIVRCACCGREIDMLNADTVGKGSGFVCKGLVCIGG